MAKVNKMIFIEEDLLGEVEDELSKTGGKISGVIDKLLRYWLKKQRVKEEFIKKHRKQIDWPVFD